MKRTVLTIAVFAILTITFSTFSGCSGTTSNNGNVTNANINANTGTKSGSENKTVYPPLASGLAEAEFELIPDGSKLKISEKKGKVVLINIWGTWCGPCRAEMPTLIALQDQYRDRGFEIIGANIGDGEGGLESNEKITKFVEEMKLNYTIVRSSNAVTKQFYTVTKQQVVPQSILVDREGHMRALFVGGGPNVFASMQETIGKAMNE